MSQCQARTKKEIDQQQILAILEVIERRIRHPGLSNREQAILYYQLGILFGQMADFDQRKFAWEKAHRLDPENLAISVSLKSLSV
jgi:hypothetical protein